MKKKRYIKTLEDIKYCEEHNKPIFNENDYFYYEFCDGVWCKFDGNKDVLYFYNAGIYMDDSAYYYEEESEEQQEATEKDIGKLCWFWDYDNNKFIEVLAGYDKDCETPYECGVGWYNKHCRPLTKEEIKEFMEKAE